MNSIKGVVIQGEKKGRKLGFPTANIQVVSDLDLEQGVYSGHTIIKGEKHKSALYLAGGKIIEAFIFDFQGDLYGQEVYVEIIEKIRNKKKFKNEVEAIKQITKDILEIKKCLQE
jgi:riboflavin kinase / FMN adenylyltransferase